MVHQARMVTLEAQDQLALLVPLEPQARFIAHLPTVPLPFITLLRPPPLTTLLLIVHQLMFIM